MTTTFRSAARRLLSISAAGLAAAGLVGFSTPAHAADADSKVWVCKYVGKPGVNETLKSGKNPIRVSGHSVDQDKDGEIKVGDQFADAQGRSVVVQIGGASPGATACSATPPTVPPTKPPKPGDGAPHTGGEGSDVPVGLVGGGALFVGAGLVAAEAERRRRAAARR